MIDRPRTLIGGGWLIGIALLACLAPWLGLRDPGAQPDGLVLRDLPPLSRVDALRLTDGSLRWVHEFRGLPDGGVEYRRGSAWQRLSASDLVGGGPADWHRRPWFVLGTDSLGRDLLSRLLHGSRVSLLVGLLGAAIAVGAGTFLGLLAGLGGGWIDGLAMRFTDVILSVPRLFLALLLVALHGASMTTTVLVVGLTTWMAAARLVRGEILSARERDWVHAARAAGARPWQLAWRHLLPAARGPLVVEGTLRVGETILLEASLSFLGLGVPAPSPSWGNLIADGRHSLLDAWWIATLPGLAIAATVIALNLLGEGLQRRVSGRAG